MHYKFNMFPQNPQSPLQVFTVVFGALFGDPLTIATTSLLGSLTFINVPLHHHQVTGCAQRTFIHHISMGYCQFGVQPLAGLGVCD